MNNPNYSTGHGWQQPPISPQGPPSSAAGWQHSPWTNSGQQPSWTPPPPKPKSGRTWLWVVISVIVVGLVLGLTFLLTRKPTGQPAASPSPSKPQSAPPEAKTIVAQPPMISGSVASTQCFSVTLPAGYAVRSPELESTCRLRLNLASGHGDVLTEISINPERNLDSAQAFIDNADELFAAGELNSDEPPVGRLLQLGTHQVALVALEIEGLQVSSYFIPQQPNAWEMQGTKVAGYVVMGYSYNAALRKQMEDVVASLQFR